MRGILGGVVCISCLCCLGPALAQGAGAPDGWVEIGSGSFGVADAAITESPSGPIAAQRFQDERGRLILAGGITPASTPTRAYVWDPAKGGWQPDTSLGSPSGFLSGTAVAAAWFPGSPDLKAGVLWIGNGSQLPQVWLGDAQGTFDDTCALPSSESLLFPRLVANPTGAFGTRDPLLLVLETSDTGDLGVPLRDEVYGVRLTTSALSGAPKVCLRKLFTASATHEVLLEDVVLDPAADGGKGLIVFTGGLRPVSASSQGRFDLEHTASLRALRATGTAIAAPDLVSIPGADSPVNPSDTVIAGTRGPEGTLTLVTRLGPGRLLLQAGWDTASGRYAATGQPVLGTANHGAIVVPNLLQDLQGPLFHLAALADGTLLLEGDAPSSALEASPGTLGYVVPLRGSTLRGVALHTGSVQLLGSPPPLAIWRNLDNEIPFRISSPDLPPTSLVANAYWLEGDPLRESQASEIPDDGQMTVTIKTGFDWMGPTTLALEISPKVEPPTVPILSTTIRLEHKPRDASLYDGFGCGGSNTSKQALVLLFPFLTIAAGLRRRRRGKSAWLLLAALPGTLASPAQAEDSEPRPRLAFLGVAHTAGIPDDDATAVSDYAQMLLASSEGYELIRVDEVRALIGFERQRQLLGCEEASCGSGFGNLLDASRLLRLSLSEAGDALLVQMSLIDYENQSQISATGMRLDRASDISAVLDVLPDLLNKLLADDPEFHGERIRPLSRNVHALTRERRWSFGGGVDVDLARARTMLGVHIAYRGSHFGFGVSFLPRMAPSPLQGHPSPVGTRVTLRLRLFDAGAVHPHLSAGVTYFSPNLVLARAGLYTEIDLWRLLRIFAAASYEYLLDPRTDPFADNYLLLTAGLAITP